MYFTKPMLLEIESFTVNIIHHEERAKYYLENFPNFTNPLVSNTEEVNYTFIFKEATSQPTCVDFMERTRKEIVTNENDKHWNLVRIRKINGKKTIVYIWSLNIKRAPDGSLIKKACLCDHGYMQKLGMNDWNTYSPVVNWMSIRTMPNMINLIDIHTKSVYFVLAYTQADVKADIFMELSILFRVEGDHPI